MKRIIFRFMEWAWGLAEKREPGRWPNMLGSFGGISPEEMQKRIARTDKLFRSKFKRNNTI